MSWAIYTVQATRILKTWSTSMAIYGGAGAAVFCYVTDWKVTNKLIPFYGKKFDDESNL